MHTMTPHHAARGTLWHARHAPATHRFEYPSAMLLLDLDQLDTLAGTRLNVNQSGLLSFKTKRHLIDDTNPSGQVARNWVSERLDVDVSGRVLLLTNPHVFGVGFNPLSVYFLHDQDEKPAALIYEVSNTPWNEIHCYAIPAKQLISGELVEFDKAFHVSPFNPIKQVYQTRVRWPSEGMASVFLGLRDADSSEPMFEAGLRLTFTPFEGRALKPLFIGMWPQTFVVLGGIYREAFALWRKGVPYHSHP